MDSVSGRRRARQGGRASCARSTRRARATSPSCRRRRACRGRRPTGWPSRSRSTAWCAATTHGRFCLGLRADRARPGRRRRASRSPSWPGRRSTRCATTPARACSCSCARATRGAACVSLQSPHGLRWIVPEGALLPLDRRLGRPACWPASRPAAAGSRASRSASPASRRSARRCVDAGGRSSPRSASADRSSG